MDIAHAVLLLDSDCSVTMREQAFLRNLELLS